MVIGKALTVKRGEIWWADFGPSRGSAPADRRPALVVQADAFNRGAIRTIVVLPMTSNLARGGDPGNVVLSPAASGLSKPSVVNVSQLSALDRSDLHARVARLSTYHLTRVDEGLRMVLSL